jgi:hypothetical protein
MRIIAFAFCLFLLCTCHLQASESPNSLEAEPEICLQGWPVCTYQSYLCSYYGRLLHEKEALQTVRPLEEDEMKALAMSIELIRTISCGSKSDDESRMLSDRYHELESLLCRGRIKGDDDPDEQSNGTKMTAHRPSDPSDPFEGDIYINERSLLQNVVMPLQAINRLEGAGMGAAEKVERRTKLRKSLFEGIVLLASYLIHECRHRTQRQALHEGEALSQADLQRIMTEMEDPAYADQSRFLLLVFRSTDDPSMRDRISSLNDTIFMEITAKYPDMIQLREMQLEWRKASIGV